MHCNSAQRSAGGCLSSSNADAISISGDRRNFISAMASAAGLGAIFGRLMLPFAPVPVLAKGAKRRKRNLIDVHHHLIPSFYIGDEEYRELVNKANGGKVHPAYSSGWTAEKDLEEMDENDVETAILSLSTPGVWLGKAAAAKAANMAHRVNVYMADLIQRYRGRFGFFATIPLPDTESSLREIAYALDVLKADGIGLMTSYDGKHLGDSSYEPVIDKLNRRKAVVFVHPTPPPCCRDVQPLRPVMFEVPDDTTRAIGELLFSGTLEKFPDIRFIFAHAGGTLPMMIPRMHQYAPDNWREKAPKGIEYYLRRLYYDIAGTSYPPAIAALMSLVPPTQILFGSDKPFLPIADTVKGMTILRFSRRVRELISRGNVLRLMPELKRN
jgi:6-methylsalicylate decarboxylase